MVYTFSTLCKGTLCIELRNGCQIKLPRFTEVPLDNVFRVNNMAGFKIKSIHCDNEYRSLMQELESIYEV
jgi:hypothetical protein